MNWIRAWWIRWTDEDTRIGWLFRRQPCGHGSYYDGWHTHIDCGCPFDGYVHSRWEWFWIGMWPARFQVLTHWREWWEAWHG